ncbi:hypothetical protein [Streptomyces achromogenes]|uniref:hypothetical protein n=1 Tax=Streptomyces achromogenes TaxID=67255 RepID=UPI0034141185
MTDLDTMRRYDQLTERVYGERRLRPGTRDLILALGWVTLRDPQRHRPEATVWGRTREVLNADNSRLWKLIAEDVPRYEHDWHADPVGCQAPMVRAGRLCGRTTTIGFPEFDPVTGWMTYWGFCSRPRCRAYMQPIHDRAEGSKDRAPEPVPNTGGMLPLFFTWDWETTYRRAMELVRHDPSWQPPSYGLSADAWPSVPGQERPRAFPRLRLVASNGQTVKRDGPVPVPART